MSTDPKDLHPVTILPLIWSGQSPDRRSQRSQGSRGSTKKLQGSEDLGGPSKSLQPDPVAANPCAALVLFAYCWFVCFICCCLYMVLWLRYCFCILLKVFLVFIVMFAFNVLYFILHSFSFLPFFAFFCSLVVLWWTVDFLLGVFHFSFVFLAVLKTILTRSIFTLVYCLKENSGTILCYGVSGKIGKICLNVFRRFQ